MAGKGILTEQARELEEYYDGMAVKGSPMPYSLVSMNERLGHTCSFLAREAMHFSQDMADPEIERYGEKTAEILEEAERKLRKIQESVRAAHKRRVKKMKARSA